MPATGGRRREGDAMLSPLLLLPGTPSFHPHQLVFPAAQIFLQKVESAAVPFACLIAVFLPGISRSPSYRVGGLTKDLPLATASPRRSRCYNVNTLAGTKVIR